jgi:RND family efflux transporter MFP subunit
MNSKKKRFYLITSIILLVFLVFIYFRLKANLETSGRQPVYKQTVELAPPARGDITRKLSFTGDILAFQQANIYTRVSGNIEKMYVDIGSYAPAGKTLARIDQTLYLQNVRQTEGLYKQALATLENNKTQFERNKDLFKQGLISQSDLDNSETSVKVAQAQVDATLANYKNAQTQLDYCDIRAPFSGYITKKLLDPGSYITANAVTSSSTIFVLSQIDKLKVMVNILEKDLPLLDKIIDARVTTDSYPDQVFTAKVKRISEAFDLSTRTMPVEINIDNRNLLLKPGMFAKIDLILQSDENVLLLPNECTLKDDQGDYVYMVSPDSVVHKHYIKLGIESDNKDEILSGLTDSDKVVVLGMELIKDGSKVRIGR